MDIQTITKKYAYKIEPKPEGGFIARATDPTVPAIEGATREEVQRKIRDTVFSGLSQAFPGLKFPVQSKNAKLEFHIERKAEGGFEVHSTELGSPTMAPATHEKVDHLAEQLLGFLDKHFPEFSQAMAAGATSDEVQIVANETTEKSVVGLPGNGPDLLPTSTMKSESGKAGINWTGEKTSGTFDGFKAISNTPITPQGSSNWTVLRTLLIALAIAGLVYFLLVHR